MMIGHSVILQLAVHDGRSHRTSPAFLSPVSPGPNSTQNGQVKGLLAVLSSVVLLNSEDCLV